MSVLVDSHCHLDFPELAADLPAVLANMAANGVGQALCVGVSLENFPLVRDLAETYSQLFASVGVHPDHQEGEEPTVDRLLGLSAHPKVVAIGETGLDYYRLQGDLEWQRERFRTHIRAAKRAHKPLIIHTREAAADTLRVMREENAGEARGVMHCFTETWDVARAALDLGFFISFSGIVTFRNASALREVARLVPLDRLLVETDAPYLAPVPYRGKINQPAYVLHVAEEVARLRGVDLDAVAEATTTNFQKLFLT
ncbi:MAG TPA: TatD family hydrolase [Burkholderiales bacterium]|nr:TatD family hydrolase [Burkholderiales bacterium]